MKDPNDIIKAILWHYRHIEPSLSIKVTEQDEKALADCLEYLKVEGKVTAVDRPGCYIVALTDKDGNAIVPIENNQADFNIGEKARNRKRLAEEAVNLANRVRNSAAGGEFSSSTVMELCDTVLALV